MSEKLRVRCGGCQAKIKVPLSYRGRKIRCPQCEAVVRVPAPAESPATVVPVRSGATQAGSTATQPARSTRPKKRPVPASSEPVDDFADLDLNEFPETTEGTGGDRAGVDFVDYQLPPKPRRKRKPRPDDEDLPPARKRKRRPKRREAPSFALNLDANVFGGLALMLFGGGLFWWAWINGYIWPWAGIICVVGVCGVFKGLLGLGDD